MDDKNVFYRYDKLRGKIVEKYGNITNFLKHLEISQTSFYKKISNKVEFKQSEILEICRLLEIPLQKIYDYFFEI